MRLFITGGAGFIGSTFIRHALSSDEHSVVNYDLLTYAGNLRNLENVADHPRYQFVRGDICDATAVDAAMTGCDVVVHFAAESHVDRSIYDPSPVIRTNVLGTQVLLDVARAARISKFVHVSTDEVYGDLVAGGFASENYPLRPSSPYAASKVSADLLVLSYVRTFGLPAVVTRASNNYGPYQFPEKFVPLMISNAMQDIPLPIYGDGRQQRDWLHVDDHCRAIMAVLTGGKEGEIYNIGGGHVECNVDVVRRILRKLGKSESLMTRVADRPGHDRRYALDSSKIRRELGWCPEIDLDHGLGSTIDWYRNNQSWLEFVRTGEYREYYEKYYTRRDATLGSIAMAERA
jgi:dTDP-glucose 4,6-dehydratase